MAVAYTKTAAVIYTAHHLAATATVSAYAQTKSQKATITQKERMKKMLKIGSIVSNRVVLAITCKYVL